MLDSASLIIIVIYAAFLAGIVQLRASAGQHVPGRMPRAALILFVIVALPTALQFAVPALLPALQRDATRIMAGEVWRIATALVVQDGGAVGSVFNLLNLLLIGIVASAIWQRDSLVIGIFFGGGMLSELVALFWQPVGAGNSVANFSLAGSVCALCLVSRRSIPARVAAAVALCGALLLVWRHDIHGAAMLFGTLIGLALAWRHAGRMPPAVKA